VCPRFRSAFARASAAAPGRSARSQRDHSREGQADAGQSRARPDAHRQEDQVPGYRPAAGTGSGESDAIVAAVAAYRASIQDGKPISERKLAEMFGKTSRRWVRSRMAEARQGLAPVRAENLIRGCEQRSLRFR
jgi:hypothetical protein